MIVGIGPGLSRKLNELGIFELKQLAEMGEDGMRGLDEEVNGRALRDDWFGQARGLVGAGA